MYDYIFKSRFFYLCQIQWNVYETYILSNDK